MEFALRGQSDERRMFVRAFEEFCCEHAVPAAARQAADLAIEEHLTNVINYGYEPGATRCVVVRLEAQPDCLRVEVEDNAKDFDPLAKPRVDTTVSLEEKPIGGLGIHLMRQFMDELSHTREGDRNVLRMAKRYPEK